MSVNARTVVAIAILISGIDQVGYAGEGAGIKRKAPVSKIVDLALVAALLAITVVSRDD
jgi:hypothetical protein